ncbi:histidine phosphatase family protein [Virgibacillus sp. SK37]|uniref:histidine phosphatase family protein n=1 Tax=Virgibacillus sp. SK37 TaxID=403957 RepID=UPI0004D0D86D|nr:histidine phosphatase family protein [Virgibacillus sp. SK37]AIF42862.1 alpha-ribazole phosphatase [Virgibacillus sp. SK37]
MDNGVAITLFRHGVTHANLEKRYVGWSDPPITMEAKQVLMDIANALPRFEFCMTSDLKRCTETAACLAPYVSSIESKAFRELHFGKWEMQTYETLCQETAYREWLDHPFEGKPPGGERFTEMEARVVAGWAVMKKQIDQGQYSENLLVTHGGVIRLLLSTFTREKKRFWDWHVPHQRGIRLYWTLADWKEGDQCTSLQVVPITESENG